MPIDIAGYVAMMYLDKKVIIQLLKIMNIEKFNFNIYTCSFSYCEWES